MSFSQLKPELWIHILSFLAPALPKPLSGWTKSEAIGERAEIVAKRPDDGAPGTTSRSAIRAPDLAVLARVSIAMNHLATDTLYRRVITDDLGSLLTLHGAPAAHPRLATKHSLLLRIKFLTLEYRPKHMAPTYRMMMENGSYMRVYGLDTEDADMAAYVYARFEAEELLRSLELFRNVVGRSPSLRLTQVTIGTIFGGQDGLWSLLGPPADDIHLSDNWSDSQQLVAQCQMATEAAFHSLPNLIHFCLRGTRGPLSLPPGFAWYQHDDGKPSPASPLFTIHFSMRTTPLPIAYGHRTRWMYEHHGYRNIYEDIFAKVIHGVNIATARRRESLAYFRSIGRVLPGTQFDLAVWASGDRMGQSDSAGSPDDEFELLNNMHLGADFERMATREFAQKAQLSLGKKKGSVKAAKRDKYEMHSSVDSPRCDACSWEYERGPLEGKVIGLDGKEAASME